jgi:hypothetical protein
MDARLDVQAADEAKRCCRILMCWLPIMGRCCDALAGRLKECASARAEQKGDRGA